MCLFQAIGVYLEIHFLMLPLIYVQNGLCFVSKQYQSQHMAFTAWNWWCLLSDQHTKWCIWTDKCTTHQLWTLGKELTPVPHHLHNSEGLLVNALLHHFPKICHFWANNNFKHACWHCIKTTENVAIWYLGPSYTLTIYATFPCPIQQLLPMFLNVAHKNTTQYYIQLTTLRACLWWVLHTAVLQSEWYLLRFGKTLPFISKHASIRWVELRGPVVTKVHTARNTVARLDIAAGVFCNQSTYIPCTIRYCIDFSCLNNNALCKYLLFPIN